MMPRSAFERFAGFSAIVAGVAGFVYALAFLVIQRSAPAMGALLSALMLCVAGFFATAALIGVYERLRPTDAAFAAWAALLSLAGALGSLIHAGYDLANAINPPRAVNADVPSQIDPRGQLTFGLAAVGLFVICWLIVKGGRLPRGLGYWGYLSAVLLAALYLGRLIVLDPGSPIIAIPAVVNGFVVGPVWYVWLGAALWRGGKAG